MNKVISAAGAESHKMGQTLNSGHMLLGILLQDDPKIVWALQNHGVTAERIREVLASTGPSHSSKNGERDCEIAAQITCFLACLPVVK